jgi:hypothetical protein
MNNMNDLRYDKEAMVVQNLFRFWLIFCQNIVFFQLVSFVCHSFMNSFPWQIIVAVSFGASVGTFFRRKPATCSPA